MATSGVTDLGTTRETIIYSALRLVGAYATGGSPKAHQVTDANTALNLMIKAWQIQNFLWVKEYATLFLVKGQSKYLFPGAKGAITYNETTTSAAHSSTDTVITLTSSSGMAIADIIGILLSDGTMHWDTITSVDSTTQVTLTTGLAGASSSGAVVYSYTEANALYRMTHVFNGQRIESDGSEIPIDPMSRDDYSTSTGKTTEGTVNQYYYDPQLSVGKLYVWQTASDNKGKLVLDVDRPLEVMIDSADTYDFPQEFLELIKYGLAVRLAPEYSVPVQERRELVREFAAMVANLVATQIDDTSVFLGAKHG